jgi:hypothetical protein
MSVDGIDPERKCRTATLIALNVLDLLSQIGNSYLLPGTHVPCLIILLDVSMFLLCSHLTLSQSAARGC